jgi:hypothetical protein
VEHEWILWHNGFLFYFFPSLVSIYNGCRITKQHDESRMQVTLESRTSKLLFSLKYDCRYVLLSAHKFSRTYKDTFTEYVPYAQHGAYLRKLQALASVHIKYQRSHAPSPRVKVLSRNDHFHQAHVISVSQLLLMRYPSTDPPSSPDPQGPKMRALD